MTDQQIAQACCRGGGEMVKAFAWGQTPFQFALVLDTQGGSTSQLYGLFATTCGAGLFTSSWALTFWICAACSLSWAVNACIPSCCPRTVASNSAILFCCLSDSSSMAWGLKGTLFPLASTRIAPTF